MDNKDEIFIEQLKDGHFVKTPINTQFIAIGIGDKTVVNITCDGPKIIIRAGGIGPKGLVIKPIESDAIEIMIADRKPILNNKKKTIERAK